MPIKSNETMGNIIYKKFIKKDNNIYLFYINNDGEMVKDWLCSEFSVDKVRYNEETKDFSYDLIIKSLFGETTCCVSKGLFTYKRFNELSEKGLIQKCLVQRKYLKSLKSDTSKLSTL